MKNSYNKVIFIIIGALVIFSVAFAIVFLNANKDTEAFKQLRSNNFNKVDKISVSDSDMALRYLSDYSVYLNSDIKKAYSLLNENYKQTKFPTLNLFENFTKNLKFNVQVDSYKVEVVDNNYVFHITANPNVNFIFRTTGVMQYTVEIK